MHGHLQAHLHPICVLAKCLHVHCIYLSMCMYILTYADSSGAETSQDFSVRAWLCRQETALVCAICIPGCSSMLALILNTELESGVL